MNEREDFARLGDLLGEACELPALRAASGGARSPEEPIGTAGSAPQDPARLLALVWPEVVGPEVAANARPEQLKRGRLVASASSTVWAQTLQFMSDAIMARLNERLGAGAVTEVVFRHAGWEERPRAGRGGRSTAGRSRAVALSADQEAALERVNALSLPPDVREQITRAMKAVFGRGEQDSVR
jgi:hypothetical protein